jgi:hypothetical protein
LVWCRQNKFLSTKCIAKSQGQFGPLRAFSEPVFAL